MSRTPSATCGIRSGEREERYGKIEESVALLRNAIRNSSFITSRHLHFIKLLSLISFRFYYLSAETVFALTTDGCNIYTCHTHKGQKNESISPAEEKQWGYNVRWQLSAKPQRNVIPDPLQISSYLQTGTRMNAGR